QFIEQQQSDRGLSLLTKYPVLAKLLVIRTQNWIAATQEFLTRLKADLHDLQEQFAGLSGRVQSLTPGLSDSHHHGRTVIFLSFEAGPSVIYKPRSLALEIAFEKLLTWLNQRSSSLHLKTYAVLERGSHGWVEVIQHQPCDDQVAAARFFRRAGMLLCVLNVLNATDCHQENLIAAGEDPVLIDLETVIQPEVKSFLDDDMAAQIDSIAFQQLQQSVLRTGMLPRWEMTGNGGAYDASGLGGVGEQPDPFVSRVWQHINTDAMALVYEQNETLPVYPNEVFIREQSQSPGQYVEDLAAGFTDMYGILTHYRDQLLAADSPLEAFGHQSIRILFRNSQLYAHLLDRSLRPKALQSGLAHSLEFEPLSVGLLKPSQKPAIWPILRAECLSLELLDIPHFMVDSSQTALEISAGYQILEALESSSLAKARERIQALSPDDLAYQVGILRATLALRDSLAMDQSAQAAVPVNISATPPEDRDPVLPLLTSDLVEAADQLAQALASRQIRSQDGNITWLGIAFLPQAQRLQLQPLGYGLYDGLSGLALFFAAMYRQTGAYQNLTLNTLQGLRKALALAQSPTDQSALGSRLGLGGGSGLGSILYTLMRVGQWLEDPSLWVSARQAADLITPELLDSDGYFDLVLGGAGTLLGLLALYKVDPSPEVLQRAILCGDHLLKYRIPGQKGGCAWPSATGERFSGISHGAGGIAYALLKLGSLSGDERFHAVAQEALTFETSLMCDGNWYDYEPNLSEAQQPPLLTTWCHGAPGIGLARLGSLPHLDSPQLQADIERARQTTQGIPLQPNDTLCCGNLGRIDFLLTLAQTTHNLELHKHCQHQVAAIVQRAHQTGGYQLFPDIKGSLGNPGFFQGMSGVGYELLRMAHPEKFPSVLLWH
ncbi:MAG: type 2 lanthipeptide synthetase LanM family protein, partial [Cyanophyceae cyanobacterium]